MLEKSKIIKKRLSRNAERRDVKVNNAVRAVGILLISKRKKVLGLFRGRK